MPRSKHQMYVMPLIFCVWGSDFGVGESIFCIGVLGVWRFVIGILSRDRKAKSNSNATVTRVSHSSVYKSEE